ncbi:L-2-amino-thiazoline-4-carboxylic acid hydrolase [Dysosmobacter sp.]|uniref:L-2-amino-thiazoline-4-carboxylic acid hydrolase n=1 Tax=Dysosmobacter sp. TaxID=2591382 RepID=UPI002A8F5406|nr:L-2-amino-thiazoline-4-carboxylic acid hydrolase [Dysosmobacter sp.]MDY3282518.1 L-2-amino-thiazoline-4-carboxylic acid hydrolase [Dysosmobacter sp.]
MGQMIDREEAKWQVEVTIDRLVHFYYHTVQTLIAEFGEEEARRLIQKIIADFGADCGRATRAQVEALGKENSIVNHSLGKEIPPIAFESRKIATGSERVKMTEVTVCPYARAFQELDFARWGRLYCEIDHAKYSGYNERFVCHHDKNLLDGDDRCIIRVEDPEPPAGK